MLQSAPQPAAPIGPRGRTLRIAMAIVGLVVVGIAAGVSGMAVLGLAGQDIDGPGSIHELRLVNGDLLVGEIVERNADAYVVRYPAVLQAAAALPASSAEPDFYVQALTAEPFNIAGPILVPRGHVVFIGRVGAGSALAAAWQRAVAPLGTLPSASPE